MTTLSLDTHVTIVPSLCMRHAHIVERRGCHYDIAGSATMLITVILEVSSARCAPGWYKYADSTQS